MKQSQSVNSLKLLPVLKCLWFQLEFPMKPRSQSVNSLKVLAV